mmetsp:Transcript_60774/g.69459  ORF Transcript_60774/g.69459 Transcript_60774/m.69459 type:complete len:200 (+) Transcript_60774:1258-1857(+)
MALSFIKKAVSSPRYSTKMVITGTLFLLGDLMSQGVEIRMKRKIKEIQPYDPVRTFRRTVFGAFIATPLRDLWFVRILPRIYPGRDPKTIIKKILLDQAVNAPTFITTFFFCSTLLEGGTIRESKKRVSEKLFPTLLVNWRVWPFAQAINFIFVPVPLQPHFANLVSMFWSAYLSDLQAKASLQAKRKIRDTPKETTRF